MLARYLKESYYYQLLDSIDENIDWYCSEDADVAEIGLEDGYYETSVVDLPEFTLVKPNESAGNEEKNENDLANIKILYGAWRRLTPLQARNKYLWTYYCHCEPKIKLYIRARWMSGKFSAEQIKNLFFVSDSKRNLVRGNALSSLWWKGFLTYDENNLNNPFLMTQTLGTTTNLADFLDTYNSFNPKRAKGVITGIAEAMTVLGEDQLRNQPFRDLNRYLNRRAAVVNFDYLDEEEIKKIAYDKFLDLCT